MKKLLFILLGLVVLYLVLCAIGPSDMNLSVSKKMNATPDDVLSQVSDYNKWSAWSPWAKLDPEMKLTVSGNPGESGHAMEWSGNKKVGTGKQWISEIVSGESVTSGLKFGDWPDTSYATLSAKAEGEGSLVTWDMKANSFPFFLRGMMLFMNPKGALQKDYEDGLNNLAAVVEALPKGVAYEVIDTPEQWYVGKVYKSVNVKTTPPAEMQKMYSDGYDEIGKFLGSMKTAMAGPPFSIAHNYSDTTSTCDLEVALPVAAQLTAPAGLNCASIPAGRTARYVYTGPYSGLAGAWGGFMTSLAAKNQPRWSGYEIYITDPGNEPDSTKWITHLMQPVK